MKINAPLSLRSYEALRTDLWLIVGWQQFVPCFWSHIICETNNSVWNVLPTYESRTTLVLICFWVYCLKFAKFRWATVPCSCYFHNVPISKMTTPKTMMKASALKLTSRPVAQRPKWRKIRRLHQQALEKQDKVHPQVAEGMRTVEEGGSYWLWGLLSPVNLCW